MSTSQQPANQANNCREDDPQDLYHDPPTGLGSEAHTTQRLHHAPAHHLHMTNRRFFIGPIPEGWLQNHRKSWYKTRLRFKNYSSRAVSFAPDPVVEHYRENPRDENPRDETEPLSPVPERDTTLTEGTESDDPDMGQLNESGEREDVSALKDLQTIDYPLNESDEAPQPSTPDELRPSESNQRNPDSMPAITKQGTTSSYFTATEFIPDGSDNFGQPSTGEGAGQEPENDSQQSLNIPTIQYPSQQSSAASASGAESTRALLKSGSRRKRKAKRTDLTPGTLDEQDPQGKDTTVNDNTANEQRTKRNFLSPLSNKVAKYNIDDNLLDKRQRMQARITRTHDGFSAHRPHRRRVQEGEIVKAEKMLVRVEETQRKNLPKDFNEHDSLKTETRLVDRWREFLVVCRKLADKHAPFSLQMYKTRVIPEVQKPATRTKPHYEIHLNHQKTSVNLYSSLDKTIVIWGPCKFGTSIYIVRPKSGAHAIEWYTFLQQLLGWDRPSSLPINVPDLGVALIFKNPFVKLPSHEYREDGAEESGGLSRATVEEEFAARAIVRGCLEMLENRPEWADVLKRWLKTEKIGLAWKRYDRLEWVFGLNEVNMYGSIAMARTHELELRPRRHYPTAVRREGNKEEEPPPVEGFLVRLTSQRGVQQRMKKMFFKRLYFFTQNNYFLFTRPSNALPPPPPKMSIDESNVPSSQDILKKMPLSYDIDPYPIRNGEVSWLSGGNEQFVKRHDEEAYAQAQRNIHNLTHADGYVDLCRVQEVRQVQRGSSPADPNISEGQDVEFNRESRDTRRDDGATGQFDDDRTFEMVLDNGLVLRLQTYNEVTRDEWIRRLDALAKYWRARSIDDAAELKAIRQRNLDVLDIDEEMESLIGQFARKWEVKKAEASPHLHNMCNLLGCRTIKMSGNLYRKPRRRSTFQQCSVILTAGKLLIFRSSLRKQNGVEIAHIHQQLETSIDLENCYIYSGFLTDSDLLYANQTFDNNRPGLHALPRIYLSSDLYTSCDEDTAISFVIWQPLQKNFFRARQSDEQGEVKQTLRHVSKLGVQGRTTVFKARSRVEKDRWVLSIISEIDRIQESRQEDIRIVTP